MAVDFKSFLKDKKGFDSIYIIIDRLIKQTITVSIKKSLMNKSFAELYYNRVWRLYGFFEIMVFNKGT